ncbi:hypothetical protein UCDDS831_g09021 [Diplodia seriata]|uniref:Uncharacterized protein n=1 Tax=Diplodia seriata TaxID=420778 RepID=A0A0G2DT30_9PEZI|nr:hypothetical protein UCDDS831_g09021 [Diplodia seriata]
MGSIDGIPSIDEVLLQHQSPTSGSTTKAADSPSYQTVETIHVPALPSPPPVGAAAGAPPPLPPRSWARHSRYYSSSSTSTDSVNSTANSGYTHQPSPMANPVDDDSVPRTRSRPRSRSLFSFRSRSSSTSSGSRTSLDYGDDSFDDDAMVAAARKGGSLKQKKKMAKRGRSRTNSIHAAAVLPAVLVLSAECFTPGREAGAGEQGK